MSDPRQPSEVPIDELTREEILAKVDELRRMAEGCHAHADELLRYCRERVGTVAK